MFMSPCPLIHRAHWSFICPSIVSCSKGSIAGACVALVVMDISLGAFDWEVLLRGLFLDFCDLDIFEDYGLII